MSGRKRKSITPKKQPVLALSEHVGHNPVAAQVNPDLAFPEYIGEDPLAAIPFSTLFQTSVPEVSTLLDLPSYCNETEDSRWLGTRVWTPAEVENDPLYEDPMIGKGRHLDPCTCVARGSEDCVKLSVRERRAELRLDLGPAFDVWKFDEMGEEVARSWSVREQRTFDSIVMKNTIIIKSSHKPKKEYTSLKRKSFVKPALDAFPTKNLRDIISYYFNVFVLRRFSTKIREGAPVDSDVDTVKKIPARSKKGKGPQPTPGPSPSSMYLKALQPRPSPRPK